MLILSHKRLLEAVVATIQSVGQDGTERPSFAELVKEFESKSWFGFEFRIAVFALVVRSGRVGLESEWEVRLLGGVEQVYAHYAGVHLAEAAKVLSRVPCAVCVPYLRSPVSFTTSTAS